MNRPKPNYFLWTSAVIAVAVIGYIVTDLPRESTNDSAVNASQREIAATLQAIQSAGEETSISFKTDDDGYIVQFSARGQNFDRTDAEILEGLTTLEHLELAETAITDEALNSIGKLHRLSTAILDNTQITSAGLMELTDLEQLQHLSLVNCPVSDDGVEALARVDSLRILNLSGTQISDSGLAGLKPLTQLERLYLNDTVVTGEGFRQLEGMDNLKQLTLARTPLTEAGIAGLSSFPNLSVLYLDGIAFNPDLLGSLMAELTATHKCLNGLFLTDAKLGDESIEPLKSLAELPELSVVSLQGTSISKRAFQELAAVTPEVTYQVDYPAGNE